MRLLPGWLLRRAVRRCAAQGQPVMLYLHPWELDPEQPRIPGVSRLSRFRHYVNLDKTAGRLERLLRARGFGPMRDLLLAGRGAPALSTAALAA